MSFVLDGVEKWWLTLKFVGSVVGHVFKYVFVFSKGFSVGFPLFVSAGCLLCLSSDFAIFCLKEQEEKHKEVATECAQLKASYSSIWGVPKMVGFPPKSSILIGFSITNHPFWGPPIFGNPHIPKKVGRPSFFCQKLSLHD